MLPTVRHTKYGRIRGMVVGEGGRSSGVLLYKETKSKYSFRNIIFSFVRQIYVLKF